MKNFYPEKPMLAFQQTRINMRIVIAALAALPVDKEVKRMAYIMFRNEGANGNSGINHNYCGFQADSGRWDKSHDSKITGVVQKAENGTGKPRLFLAFKDVSGCLSMLVERVQGRGLFIGGTTKKIVAMRIGTIADLCRAYKKEWVSGDAKAEPAPKEMDNFKSMYRQAEAFFPK